MKAIAPVATKRADASVYLVGCIGHPNDSIPFRRKWLDEHGHNPTKVLAVKVVDDSMQPGLYSGDAVIVDTDRTEPKDGAVFAVECDGDLVIKRLVRDAGRWWLTSDSPDQQRHPRRVYGDATALLGEAVLKRSDRI